MDYKGNINLIIAFQVKKEKKKGTTQVNVYIDFITYPNLTNVKI